MVFVVVVVVGMGVWSVCLWLFFIFYVICKSCFLVKTRTIYVKITHCSFLLLFALVYEDLS